MAPLFSLITWQGRVLLLLLMIYRASEVNFALGVYQMGKRGISGVPEKLRDILLGTFDVK